MFGAFTLSIGAYFVKKNSADGRLFMDKICIKAMCSNSLKGAGVEYFGGTYGLAQHDYFKLQVDKKGRGDFEWTSIKEHDRLTAGCPDNAFNEYLFIGVVAGPFAMLAFICVLAISIAISFKRGTIWCYGLTSFAVFALFSYPLHVWQFQMMLPVLLAASISDGIKMSNNCKIPENIALSTVLVLLAFVAIMKKTEIRQLKQIEAAWKKTERWHQMEYYDYAVAGCDTLWQYKKYDKEFLFAYGQSLNKIGEYEKSDSILKMGTEISSDPMFWNVMGNNSLAMGRYREAEERYKHAFYMVPNRLYPLNLLAKLYYTGGDTARFLDMADKVETFIPKVESASTAQLRNEIRQLKADIIIKQEP